MNAIAVEVKDLTVRYGKFIAVNGITFNVAAGEIFGFLGANGAGKTTTIRVLCGILRPTSGLVRVAGFDASEGLTPIKQRVGYMSQRFTLYDDLTVAQNLAFTAALRRMDAGSLAKRSKELFEIVGFDQSPDILVRDLSGGYRQEVSLAAAMLHDPDIVFLDEPTAGVSPAARVRFWNLIGRVASSGKTVFVTTHYMDEAEQCGRIALMRDGRIIALGSPEELKTTCFPEPLFMLRGVAGAPAGWIDKVRAHPSVIEARPHGLKWHISIRDRDGFDALVLSLAPFVRGKSILPSLEDVFIRTIERGAA